MIQEDCLRNFTAWPLYGPDMSPWRNDAIEPTLSLLDQSGLDLNPKAIVHNLEQQMQRPPSRSTVNRALKMLLEGGLVEKVDGGPFYRITDEGSAVIRAQQDPSKYDFYTE
ncbi:PhiH1 repressor-like protein [Haloferax mucosum ATCC BAA-1512]|uniref:PhiH1 repressor-like protein n=2 Tax=Haloferax mucosum TaxID=403181 RepID=M0IG58_9EURY|nr:PhiH1 repressor-like protein [Haloferax mucosum ATCC BAA-1512]